MLYLGLEIYERILKVIVIASVLPFPNCLSDPLFVAPSLYSDQETADAKSPKFERRYERWNPVHPTYGAFWGMGIGFGCGVGWGPGFGPEVVDYVGAGCGIGFNVGITLAGVGIGLPANAINEAPYNVLLATRSIASGFQSVKDVAWDGWIAEAGPRLSTMQKEANNRLSGLISSDSLTKTIDISRAALLTHGKPVLEGFRNFGSQFSKTDDKELRCWWLKAPRLFREVEKDPYRLGISSKDYRGSKVNEIIFLASSCKYEEQLVYAEWT
ncbi:Cadmium-induced protein AS8-like protein [Drosera capensis]